MLDFVNNNYVIIIVIAAFLFFAIIGYVVDTAKNKKNNENDLLTQPNDDANINAINTNIMNNTSTQSNGNVIPEADDNLKMGN